jgi:DNA topoisomerase-3
MQKMKTQELLKTLCQTMKLVIVEKPDACAAIAKVLGAAKQQGYYEGNGYLCAAAAGHLLKLAEPDAYTGSSKWLIEQLPVLPAEFILEPDKADPYKEKQLSLIKKLYQRPDVEAVINACDGDREGEVIFRYIYKYIKGKKPAYRAWMQELTAEGIKKAFREQKPLARYAPLGDAGQCRGEADWMLGMNATRALSIICNGSTLSLGRVQTPTLAIICEAYLANKNFTAAPFYTLLFSSQKNGVGFTAETERYGSFMQAQGDLQAAQSSPKRVASIETSLRTEQPPMLYQLSDLQMEGSRRYGYTIAQVDDAAQELYLKGLMSYPRTDTSFITDSVFAEVPAILKKLAAFPQYADAVRKLPQALNTHSVDSSKVTGHHALIPTRELTPAQFQSLDEAAQNVLSLVIARFITAFGEACKKNITFAQVAAGDILFTTTGSVIVYEGWRGLLDSSSEDSEDGEKDAQALPKLTQGEILNGEAALAEGKTAPPKLFTQSSLIKYMQHCGRSIDDKELKKVLVDKEGIGRPATRRAIIDTLFHRKYVEMQKKHIVPTELGMRVYGMVKHLSIVNVALTAQWEQKLDQIEAGALPAQLFGDEMRQYVAKIVSEVKQIAVPKLPIVVENSDKQGAKCPKCGKCTAFIFEFQPKNAKGKQAAIHCIDKQCGWVYFNSPICGKSLTPTQLKKLAEAGRTDLIKGFTSAKTGKPFDMRLALKPDLTGVIFDFNK